MWKVIGHPLSFQQLARSERFCGQDDAATSLSSLSRVTSYRSMDAWRRDAAVLSLAHDGHRATASRLRNPPPPTGTVESLRLVLVRSPYRSACGDEDNLSLAVCCATRANRSTLTNRKIKQDGRAPSLVEFVTLEGYTVATARLELYYARTRTLLLLCYMSTWSWHRIDVHGKQAVSISWILLFNRQFR